jgi:ADP-ribose pyrophosphatase
MTGSNLPTPLGDEVITHQGKTIEVVHQRMLIGEKEVIFEWARRAPGTRILIFDNAGRILITREYRNELRGWDYRLPGGKVFDSLREYNDFLKTGEDITIQAEQAVKREAYQEVGVNAQNVKHYHTSKCGATVEWDLYYFVAEVHIEDVGQQDLEQGENIEVGWYSPEEAWNIALSDDMREDRTVGVLVRYLHSFRLSSS